MRARCTPRDTPDGETRFFRGREYVKNGKGWEILWTEEQVRTLIAARDMGWTYSRIAKITGMSNTACQNKYRKIKGYGQESMDMRLGVGADAGLHGEAREE